jgi:formate hydrogenlyase subunit 6/NADH:ubiquinone oxidoreductase subunit I
MAKELVLTPGKCTGCTTCALTCSITYHNEFNLARSHIRIRKHDVQAVFEITFLSTCLKCQRCAEVCPSGCLRSVKLLDDSQEGGK